jgi:hypothetical protein
MKHFFLTFCIICFYTNMHAQFDSSRIVYPMVDNLIRINGIDYEKEPLYAISDSSFISLLDLAICKRNIYFKKIPDSLMTFTVTHFNRSEQIFYINCDYIVPSARLMSPESSGLGLFQYRGYNFFLHESITFDGLPFFLDFTDSTILITYHRHKDFRGYAEKTLIKAVEDNNTGFYEIEFTVFNKYGQTWLRKKRFPNDYKIRTKLMFWFDGMRSKACLRRYNKNPISR